MDLSDWLILELERRGWSNSELARRAGLVPSTISTVISGQQKPGIDFCLGVARALDVSPEYVFRLAGILPHRETRKEILDEIYHIFDQLNETDQLTIITMAWALARQERESSNPAT